MSPPTPPLLDPAPRTLPSTPRPAAVVQPDIGDGMRPLAETPQKDNRIGWHYCPMWHCEFRAKQKSILKTHMAYKHDVDVKIFSCSMCDYRAKQKSNLKTHMANRHGVDVQESDRAIHCKKCPASDDAPQLAQPQARSPDRAIESCRTRILEALAKDEDGQRRVAQAELRAQRSIAEHIEKTADESMIDESALLLRELDSPSPKRRRPSMIDESALKRRRPSAWTQRRPSAVAQAGPAVAQAPSPKLMRPLACLLELAAGANACSATN